MELTLITDLENVNFRKNKKYVYNGVVNLDEYKILLANKNITLNTQVNLNISNTRVQKIEKLEYCDQLHKKILKSLFNELNKMHYENYNEKFWKLAIGRWLTDFIYISYFNFNAIESLLNNKKFSNIIISKFENIDFHTKNYDHFVRSYLSKNWISNLNSLIIKFLNPKTSIETTKSKKKNIYKKNKIEKKINIKQLSKRLFSVINLFIKNRKKIFFYESGLTFAHEKYVQLKLSENLTLWEMPSIDYSLNNYNSIKRNKLILDFTVTNSFEKLLKTNLKYFLPAYLIEDFKNIKSVILNSDLPKNPDLILTGTGFTNEVFNIYNAMQSSKGTKFACLQHGNCYNTNYINDYLYEFKIPDYFYSWGKKRKENQYAVYNFNVVLRRKLTKVNGNLSIICNSLSNRALPFEMYNINEENFNYTLDFVENLEANIREKTFFRLLPWDVDNTNEILKTKILSKKFKLYNENLSIKKILNKSRLNIFNYDSSGFYENILLGIPSIIFNKNIFEDLKDDCIDDYKELIKANLIFRDKNNLKKHISRIWSNPLEWWNEKNTKEVINIFNSKYNNNYKNKFNILPKIIENVTK